MLVASQDGDTVKVFEIDPNSGLPKATSTEVEVGKLDGHRKRIPATVVRFPFYDPDKTRPRS